MYYETQIHTYINNISKTQNPVLETDLKYFNSIYRLLKSQVYYSPSADSNKGHIVHMTRCLIFAQGSVAQLLHVPTPTSSEHFRFACNNFCIIERQPWNNFN